MKNIKYNLLIAGALSFGVLFTGCKKDYLKTSPTTQAAADQLFKTTTSAYTALNGIHALMNESGTIYSSVHADFGTKAMDLFSDVMGNDMVCTNSGYDWFNYHYTYFVNNYAAYWMNTMPWVFYYRIINNANNIIDNIDAAEGPITEKNDIKGQALLYRAWAMQSLCQFYQFTYLQNPNAPGVPIYTHATTPDNTGHARGTLQEDYDQMTADCEQGITLLENGVVHDDKDNISAATAHGIYARILLDMGKWSDARFHAISALQDYPLMSSSDYILGFNDANNGEWMWGSDMTDEQYNQMGIVCWFSFVDATTPGYASVGATRSITSQLYNKMSATDVRKTLFDAGSNHLQHKFFVKDPTGFAADQIFMRSSEMYLIEAEAEYRMGDAPAAKATLESLVQMRDPSYTAPSGGQALLDEIWWQRRIELWGEGFGYRDMKRQMEGLNRPTGSGNHTAANTQGVLTLSPTDPELLMKIPQTEIDANEAMTAADQNPF